ncbi:hypothetical protein [Paraburkholderia sacchari]|uniref:Uncharacterized protein n=1 Tax=Paraburkholderia sacchari TaxID=159450 RepID=A0A8T6ZJU7_9BURK|nr:hypothetical protein [Paraburkholderia sacchari]NLP64882.1 hypothetical protein [Paraburkholderia sacchari]
MTDKALSKWSKDSDGQSALRREEGSGAAGGRLSGGTLQTDHRSQPRQLWAWSPCIPDFDWMDWHSPFNLAE